VLLAVRVGSIGLTLAAIGAAVIETVSAGTFDATRFFAYFTIQSNLIGVIALAVAAGLGGRRRSRGIERFRGAAAVYLTVTFFVTLLLLSDVDVQLNLVWIDFVLHKLFPVVVVLDWLVDPPHVRLSIRDGLIWLAYPIAWAVLTVIRGAIDGWYPYPFLDPANGGYGAVALVIAAIALGFIALALLFIAAGNLSSKRSGAQRAEAA
jgi:hypothetical protein